MVAKPVTEGLHLIPAGAVNVYLIDGPDGLTLIDTGFPDGEAKIRKGLASLGKSVAEIRNILVTHAHVDHVGGLAALQKESGARTWMHGADAPIAASGGPFRPMRPSPDLLGKVMFKLFVKPGATVAPARTDQIVSDGDHIPVAGGIAVIHAPGHSAGHVAYLWRDVLFVGDACMNQLGFRLSIGYEDLATGRVSLRRLGAYDYDIACFGHGAPLVGQASRKFRKRWR